MDCCQHSHSYWSEVDPLHIGKTDEKQEGNENVCLRLISASLAYNQCSDRVTA